MPPCLPRVRLFWARWRHPLGAWVLLFFFTQAACATRAPWGSLTAGYRYASLTPPPAPRERTGEPGLGAATMYEVGFVEPQGVATRPVPIRTAEFQRSFQRLSQDVRLGRRTPRQAAMELLRLSQRQAPVVETVESAGEWNLETYAGRGYTLVPERQTGPVVLTPEAEETLEQQYLHWCEPQGGSDCLGLLDDGPSLRTDDRRTFALALAFGRVLEETQAALGRQLNAQALVSMVVWTVALYCMLWVVPEPTTKLVAASLTVILMSWLGLETVYGLMDGWARLVIAAGEATTFEELRTAGEEFGRVLGDDAARAMILAVSTLAGRTLGEVAAKVKSLPGFRLAELQWEAQGGAAALAPEVVEETALAQEPALARAVAAAETVATSPQGPLAVVMLKKTGGATAQAPGGRTARTVLRHRGGNQQVELSDHQRWHLRRGQSLADIPAEDKVGDTLQEAVTRAAEEWGPDRLSKQETEAIQKALDEGEYWLARLLEREARGRFVQQRVSQQFKHLYDFNLNKGVDVIDPATGYKYEILSGTESNLARHGRRMAGEFFRMLTF
ncbi:hypothetical protein [Archangium sp.]|uniref:SitA5 family polymorphic toxin n=1 Tax=Archangium sp. TaxID=1872627 RepID=UPI003899BC90